MAVVTGDDDMLLTYNHQIHSHNFVSSLTFVRTCRGAQPRGCTLVFAEIVSRLFTCDCREREGGGGGRERGEKEREQGREGGRAISRYRRDRAVCVGRI